MTPQNFQPMKSSGSESEASTPATPTQLTPTKKNYKAEKIQDMKERPKRTDQESKSTIKDKLCRDFSMHPHLTIDNQGHETVACLQWHTETKTNIAQLFVHMQQRVAYVDIEYQA